MLPTGIIGWGESPRTADAMHIEAAIQSMRPIVQGCDPWETEAIARDIDRLGMWNFQPMTRNIAFSGIDMALWDICGKACGQPLYRIFGGAQRESVDYFYYVHPRSLEDIEQQGREGVERGYSVFYIKAGVDAAREEDQLRVLRSAIGPDRRIRIDCNMAWSPAEAIRRINRWDEMFDLDFVEAPVRRPASAVHRPHPTLPDRRAAGNRGSAPLRSAAYGPTLQAPLLACSPAYSTELRSTRKPRK